MKSIYIHKVFCALAVFIFLFSFSCEATKKTNTEAKSSEMEKITLTKTGMGGSTSLEISDKETSFASFGRTNNIQPVKTPTLDKNWEELNRLVAGLDLSQLESWEGPTQARFHDGARATTISITAEGATYNSQSFDEGKPPAELEELYNYLESLENQ